MQVRANSQKKKYKIRDFAVPGNHYTNQASYSQTSFKRNCICGEFQSSETKSCTRCLELYHKCITDLKQKSTNWQCLHCSSIYMDPIYTVESTLVESFCRTDHIFTYNNHIEFHFTLEKHQLGNPIEIRCLQDVRGPVLAWPMQGQIYLNKGENPEPVIDFKPLLANSNRRHRKDECLFLPASRVKQGKNIVTFEIPRLDYQRFTIYQSEQRHTYFFGIYSIRKLTKENLISRTIKKSRIDKSESLKLLRELNSGPEAELEIEKITVNLECPYTRGRIKIPVRGKRCTHYTCLCLDTLIQTRMRMNSREWNCPICNNLINQPIIDNFILTILTDGQTGTEVQLWPSGEYVWMQSQQGIDLDSEDGNESVEPRPQPTPGQSKESMKQKKVAQLPKRVETINLDDDDEIPLEIVVPQEQSVSLSKETDNLRKIEKQKKNRSKSSYPSTEPTPVPMSCAPSFLITDVKELIMKPIKFQRYVKHYFKLDEIKPKVSQDLRIIFKQVI